MVPQVAVVFKVIVSLEAVVHGGGGEKTRSGKKKEGYEGKNGSGGGWLCRSGDKPQRKNKS